ncbi:MAG TPA: sugar ABC transporter permease [Anaerolineales bacterium]|nr:sugar ABC transporter permease [Anaerolineales bacterium]
MKSAGEKLASYLFILPAFALVVVLLLVPMVQNIYYSFFDWDGIARPVFSGVANYARLLGDRDFLISLRNTVLWVGFTLIFPVLGGLLVAVFVDGVRFERFFKSIFFVPLTISFVATGLIWTYMFGKELGVLNNLFGLLRLPLKPSWLTGVPLNTFSMLIAWTWQQLGTNMVMFLMGLGTIPKEPIEAAIIDGAGRFETFRQVKLPMLRPITTVVITMAMVNSFKAFDIIYVMTRGGPYHSSETLAVTMFRETFTLFRMGYGSAISVFLSIVVIAVSALYIKRMANKDLLYY